MKHDEKPDRTHYDLLILQDDGDIQIFDAERIPGMLASFGPSGAIESTNKLMTEPYWDAHAKMSACLLIERGKPELPLLFHINRTYSKSRTTSFTVDSIPEVVRLLLNAEHRLNVGDRVRWIDEWKGLAQPTMREATVREIYIGEGFVNYTANGRIFSETTLSDDPMTGVVPIGENYGKDDN